MAQDWREKKSALSRFAVLRRTGLFSDCKITLKYSEDGKEKNLTKVYHAHSVVLQSASAVFEAMLSQNFIEGQNRNIILNDIIPKHFDLFLDFIYEDQCVISNTEEARGVYEIAHSYLMSTCMDFCVEYIKRNSTIDDSPLLYNFSIFFNLDDLRQALLNTILLDFDKIKVDAVDKKLMSDVLDSPISYVAENILTEKLLEWSESEVNKVENKKEVLNALISEYIPKIHFFEIPKCVLYDIIAFWGLFDKDQINFITHRASLKGTPHSRIILPRHRICQCNPVTQICSTSSKFDFLIFNSNSLVKIKPPKKLNKLSFTFKAKSDGWIFYYENGNDFFRISIQNGLLSFASCSGDEDFTYTFERKVIDRLLHSFRYDTWPYPRMYLDGIQYYNSDLNKSVSNFPSGCLQLGGIGYSFEGYLSQLSFDEELDYHSSHILASEVEPFCGDW